MKLLTLVNSVPALREVASLKLSPKKAFELSSFIKKVDVEVKTFYELNDAKIISYDYKPLEWVNAGKNIVPLEKMEEYTTYMNEVWDAEIVIETPKLSLDDLWETQVSASVFMTLDWLFVENEA